SPSFILSPSLFCCFGTFSIFFQTRPKLQNLVQGGTADNSLAKGVVPALDIFLIGYLVGHGNSPF
ncbi:hypothetical protein, partial [Intestinimonas butyriciproducens]|uniref:hypothetical protein n=1 Tax=Intestinimonas butyriciproducens TaxID=1297617 RepID=UPI003FA54A6F